MTFEELKQIVEANAQAIQANMHSIQANTQAIQGLSTSLAAEREQRQLDKAEILDEILDMRSSITTLVNSHEALTTELRALTDALNRQFSGNGHQD